VASSAAGSRAAMPTPSQTIGPFFRIGSFAEHHDELVDPSDPDAIRIGGTLFDGEGAPVADALIEIWQANRAGRYAHPEDDREDVPLEEGFDGFGRCPSDAAGQYEFVTVKPGPVPAPGGGMQAPHIVVSVFARGLLKRVATRIYFPDEVEANEADPILGTVADASDRATLIARDDDGRLRFDIHLQGDEQTVFFVV
jgi:protocatechuate 3,4-dioxygenase alpha subunit